MHQLRLSGEYDATGQGRRIVALLNGPEKKIMQAIDLPTIAVAKGMGASHLEHEIYIVALGRLAKTSMKLALLGLHKAEGKMTAQERAEAWAAIALQSSYTLAPDTSEYWRKSAGATLSVDQAQWKARIALRDGDWKTVKSTIRAMPPALRNEAAWIYWLARALMAESPNAGNGGPPSGEAAQLLRSITEQSNFYGQLALEEMGRLVTIPPAGAPNQRC